MATSKSFRRKLLLLVQCLFVLSLLAQIAWAQTTAPAPAGTVCKDGVSPGVIQITADSANARKLVLARKHFYLSQTPFNLAQNLQLNTAPSLRSYYKTAGASEQLINWLESNHCETVYCRELTAAEVDCKSEGERQCVPEFTRAYQNALTKLGGNTVIARKWILNYEPLSSPELGRGFYEARTAWLKVAVEALEKKLADGTHIQSTMSDSTGIAFFYDLCPGTYYVSTIAPIDNFGTDIVWESLKPVRVDGPPEVNKAVVVTFGFPPAKERKNFFVGRPVSEIGR